MLLIDTHVIVDDEGIIVSKYRKLHLFDVQLANSVSYYQIMIANQGGLNLTESSYIEKGMKIPDIVPSPIGNLGLSIVITCQLIP